MAAAYPANAPYTASPHPIGFQALIKQASHAEGVQNSIGLTVGVENVEFKQKLSEQGRDTFFLTVNGMVNTRGDYSYSAPSEGSAFPWPNHPAGVYFERTIISSPADNQYAQVDIHELLSHCLNIPPPLTFVTSGIEFYGVNYQKFWVSVNGYISFLRGITDAYYSRPIPSKLSPNGFVAPFFTDLELPSGLGYVKSYCTYQDDVTTWDAPLNLGIEWYVWDKHPSIPKWNGFGVQFGCRVVAYVNPVTGGTLPYWKCDQGMNFLYFEVKTTQKLTIGLENEAGTLGNQVVGPPPGQQWQGRRLHYPFQNTGWHWYAKNLKVQVDKPGTEKDKSTTTIDLIEGVSSVGGANMLLHQNHENPYKNHYDLSIDAAMLGMQALALLVKGLHTPLFLVEGGLFTRDVAERLSPSTATVVSPAAPGQVSVSASAQIADERGFAFCAAAGVSCSTDATLGFLLKWELADAHSTKAHSLTIQTTVTYTKCMWVYDDGYGQTITACAVPDLTFSTSLDFILPKVWDGTVVQNPPFMTDTYAFLTWS